MAAHRAAGPTFGMGLLRAPGYRGMDGFFAGLLDGMDEILERYDARVLLHIVPTMAEELDAYRRWHEARLVDAVLVADLVPDDPRVVLCAELGLPGVLLGAGDGSGMSVVEVDNAAAVRIAVDFLTGLGHTRLGRVSGPVRLRHTLQRDEEFAAHVVRLGAHGITVEGDYTTDSGRRCTAQLLAQEPRPTAIVYDNDVMAVAGLEVATEAGISVPDQLSILAWDDSAASRLADPPLSVVSRDVHELGHVAARALLEAAAGSTVHVRHAANARVIERRSTGRPPAARA